MMIKTIITPDNIAEAIFVTWRYYVAPSGRAMLSLHNLIITFVNYYLSYFTLCNLYIFINCNFIYFIFSCLS